MSIFLEYLDMHPCQVGIPGDRKYSPSIIPLISGEAKHGYWTMSRNFCWLDTKKYISTFRPFFLPIFVLIKNYFPKLHPIFCSLELLWIINEFVSIFQIPILSEFSYRSGTPFFSLDWFKGKFTGNHGFYHQIWWAFRLKFSHNPILWFLGILPNFIFLSPKMSLHQDVAGTERRQSQQAARFLHFAFGRGHINPCN